MTIQLPEAGSCVATRDGSWLLPVRQIPIVCCKTAWYKWSTTLLQLTSALRLLPYLYYTITVWHCFTTDWIYAALPTCSPRRYQPHIMIGSSTHHMVNLCRQCKPAIASDRRLPTVEIDQYHDENRVCSLDRSCTPASQGCLSSFAHLRFQPTISSYGPLQLRSLCPRSCEHESVKHLTSQAF